MNNYDPQPIKTDHVELSPDLQLLLERLAANAHDVWARERMDNGWSWGKHRDDETLQHPCLVPYEDLSEEEKQYDRKMVQQAIRALLALGYKITRQ